MLRNISFEIAPSETDLRLDRVIRNRFPTVSRKAVLEAIGCGAILLNGKAARKGSKVKSGDRLVVTELAEQSDLWVIPNPNLPLEVVYEDEALLALNKAPGIPVHPLTFRETATLANALVARYPELARVGDQPLIPALVHRIDTETSGLVLAAKTSDTYRKLRQQFRNRTVCKLYLAVVFGIVREPGRIESYLRHRRGRVHRMEVVDAAAACATEGLLRAVTQYEPIAACERMTLLKVTIQTGVTHQIRCQLASIGHPVLGDALYGDRCAGGATDRLFLHASGITIRHPVTEKPLRLEVPAPSEFNRFFPLHI
ncbi:MAG: RluA family pseudouridine synthase [Kiritimatiellia bacterium]